MYVSGLRTHLKKMNCRAKIPNPRQTPVSNVFESATDIIFFSVETITITLPTIKVIANPISRLLVGDEDSKISRLHSSRTFICVRAQ